MAAGTAFPCQSVTSFCRYSWRRDRRRPAQTSCSMAAAKSAASRPAPGQPRSAPIRQASRRTSCVIPRQPGWPCLVCQLNVSLDYSAMATAGSRSVSMPNRALIMCGTPWMRCRANGATDTVHRWFRFLGAIENIIANVVLLEGIELSTSPLPRECSTTELQQPTGACPTVYGRPGQPQSTDPRMFQRGTLKEAVTAASRYSERQMLRCLRGDIGAFRG